MSFFKADSFSLCQITMGVGLDKCCASERGRHEDEDVDVRRSTVRFDLSADVASMKADVPEEDDYMTAAEKMKLLKRAARRDSRKDASGNKRRSKEERPDKKRLSSDVRDWLAARQGDDSEKKPGRTQRGTQSFSIADDSDDDRWARSDARRTSLQINMEDDWTAVGGDQASEHRCRSCQNTGLDLMGLTCSCQYGAELLARSARGDRQVESTEWCADLLVTVVGASLLRGSGPAFCTCEISGKVATRFETDAIAETSSPLWNCKKQLLGVLSGDFLNFRVSQGDGVGTATVTPVQWFPRGFSGRLDLSWKESAHGQPGATLEVKIDIREARPPTSPAAGSPPGAEYDEKFDF